MGAECEQAHTEGSCMPYRCCFLKIWLCSFISLFSHTQKRIQPPEFTDPLANKRPRISRFTQRTQPPFNGKLSSTNGKEASFSAPAAVDSVSSSSLLPTLELLRPHDPLADVSNDLCHNGKDSEESAERLAQAAQPQTDSALVSKHNYSVHSKSKKKLKKHKERERKEEHQDAREKPNCELKKDGTKMGPLQDITGGSEQSFFLGYCLI